MVAALAPFTIQLRNQIEYGEQDVLRKLVVKDEKRQVMLICVKAGVEIAAHTSAHDAAITVLEGQGTYTLNGEEIALEPGIFISLPAYTPHALKVTQDLALLKVVDSHECKEAVVAVQP